MSYIVFFYEDRLYHAEAKMPGDFIIGSSKKANIKVDGIEAEQIKITENRRGIVSVISRPPFPFRDDNMAKDAMIVVDTTKPMAVFFSDEYNVNSAQIKLPYNCTLTVGRNDQNNIIIANKYVGRKHFSITSESGVVRVEDLNSANGLYLNGKRITKARLKSGDELSILHINIRLINNVLFFDNVENELRINGIEETAAPVMGGVADVKKNNEGGIKYKRSPRTQEALPSEPIMIAPPPLAGSKYEKRKGIFSSFVGTGVMTAASMATTAASPALLAARAASLVSPIISMATQSGGEKDRKNKGKQYDKLREERYGAYVEEQRAIINLVADNQRRILTQENPDARECINRLKKYDRTIWERGNFDRDFADVRIGMGYENICVDVKSRTDAGFKLETDEQQELVSQIIEETRIVDNVPSRLSLRKYQTIGIVGDRVKTVNLVRNMLISLTYSHCYTELNIIGIFDENEKEVWQQLRWLPHVWDNNHQFRFLAFDKNSAENVEEMAKELLVSRIKDNSDSSYNKDTNVVPFYLFLFGSRRYTENTALEKILTGNDPYLGSAAIFLYNDINALPHDTQFIIDVNNEPSGFAKNETNNKFIFTMDAPVTNDNFDAYCRCMSTLQLDGAGAIAEIPQGVTFLKGYGVTKTEELHAWERWERAQVYKSLAVPIGIKAGNEQMMFDIMDAAYGGQGPHGLVAGTTGSGKSETVTSWILSMCINFHPYDVNFVIIDYKGGGMANGLMELPHVVGKITNIGAGIERTLTSLNAELKRRQRVFDEYSEYEVNNIVKYQKLYHQGIAKEPMPHLIIVSDEFAELKANQPDFMAALVSAARIGRTLGVHLVLATQKPSGVVDDQINSNSNFRICLKVASSSDSREMLKRPDAARITQTGRGFLLVGEDDLFEQFQSLYSGNVYNPNAGVKDNSTNSVMLVNIDGSKAKFKKKNVKALQTSQTAANGVIEKTELMVIRSYLAEVAREHGIKKLNGPWLEELPEKLYPDDIRQSGGFNGTEWRKTLPWLQVPIGIYDMPAAQKQGTQYYDFLKDGHLGIYGAPSTGKTTLLKTIIMGLARNYSPEDVNIYIMDFGGWSLNPLSGLPHVGGVALDCEDEKILKLGQMLSDEMVARKRKFLNDGVSSLAAYREIHDGGLPAIILVIDNIIPIFDNFPDLENVLITLSSQGPTYGMYMVFTANNTTGIRYKVVQNIKGAICFEMTDKGDYTGIIGKLDGANLPKITGRAFIKAERPVIFQAAIHAPGENEKERSNSLTEEMECMMSNWNGEVPEPIPVMPMELSYDTLFKNYHIRNEIPVGVSYSNIKTVFASMAEKNTLLVSGYPNSGKSKMLTEIANRLHTHRPDDRIYVIDSKRGSLQKLQSMATMYGAASDEEKMDNMMSDIIALLNDRKRTQTQTRAEVGETFSEIKFIEGYEQICIFIDDLDDYINDISNKNKDSMERICKLSQNLGVLVIVAGRIPDIERYNSIESVTRYIVGNQLGVGLGAKPVAYSFFRNDLDYKSKDADSGEGNGFFFCDGHCDRIKIPQ